MRLEDFGGGRGRGRADAEVGGEEGTGAGEEGEDVSVGKGLVRGMDGGREAVLLGDQEGVFGVHCGG